MLSGKTGNKLDIWPPNEAPTKNIIKNLTKAGALTNIETKSVAWDYYAPNKINLNIFEKATRLLTTACYFIANESSNKDFKTQLIA